jgi:hypothetical protein
MLWLWTQTHNSNLGVFKGPRLRVQPHDHRFPEDEALAAVRCGKAPTARSWQAAQMTPSEHTLRWRFGSFRVAVATAGSGLDNK